MIKRRDYPKTFHIGTEIYKLKFVRRFADKSVLGECDPEAKEIRILCGQGPEETFRTLLHELFHAIFEFEADMELKHKLIYECETPLYNFLRDNFF